MKKKQFLRSAVATTSAALACYSMSSSADYKVDVSTYTNGDRMVRVNLDRNVTPSYADRAIAVSSGSGVRMLVQDESVLNSYGTPVAFGCTVTASDSAYQIATQAAYALADTQSASTSTARKMISFRIPYGSSYCQSFSVLDSRE